MLYISIKDLGRTNMGRVSASPIVLPSRATAQGPKVQEAQ